MLIDFSTNNEILKLISDSIDRNIKSNGSLANIESKSIGFSHGMKTQTHLNIYPMQSVIRRIYSGGEADIERIYRFEILSKKPKPEVSINLVNGLLNNLRVLFSRKASSDFWGLKKQSGAYTVANTKVGDIQPSENSYEDLLYSGHIDISFLCKFNTQLVAYSNPGSLKIEVNTKELSKVILEILNHYKAFLKVGNFFLASPVETYPGISVYAANPGVRRGPSGIDILTNDFEIATFVRAYSDTEVYSNLEITDKIISVMLANSSLSGRALQSKIATIDYGIFSSTTEDLAFGSNILIRTESYDQNIR